MRDYGKVFSRIWESDDFRSLSEDGRALVIYLLTCGHGTIAGVFRLPDGYACEDLQWSSERVRQGFDNLQEKGFATRCEASKWVWVTKFLEWNPPENPNQRKAASKMAQSVPEQCGWKLDFMRVCGPVLGVESSVDTPPESNRSGTLGEPFLNQKQEQKQEQKKPTASSPAKLPTCPYDEIVGLYREVLPELPDVRVMDDERKKGIRKRWEWVLTTNRPDGTKRADCSAEAVQWFRDYFELARDNDFLMGRGPRAGEHKNWKCDIDFLMTSKGLKHVIEKTE